MTLLSQLRQAARHAGVEVERATPMTQWRLRLPAFLKYHGVNTVLDIGANDGGFASALYSGGFLGRVVSFEPLPKTWESLRDRAQKSGKLWTVAPRLALSNENGEAMFNEAGNSVSSSLLTMTKTHTDAAANSAPVRQHTVTTRRLDDFLQESALEGPFYIKLDVQGAEKLVLSGAEGALRNNVRGLQLEMSLSNLYEGQELASELDRYIRTFGFDLWDVIPGFRRPQDYRLLQYDGVYFKA